jgi:hypothetical protein
MEPQDKRNPRRKAARAEYEVARHAKGPGRPLQRKLLQQRFDETSDGAIPAASSHGDEPSHEHRAAPPRDDRAG